ncbi:MAG: methylenetetrahydrofolate reductase (NADPH) [Candidatus Azotimanducaceae bacterium]|jgi:methylenetetrahydrofolate reductase (NADPH)|tara:strand:+ start:196 stop:1053 length:858 start_codon:yes stop_codon:yes gene_type:complete
MARIADKLAVGRTLSFEFFPPKSASAQMTLGRTVAELAPLGPDFVSITYGAGGSDRHRTADVVGWMRRETDVEPMAHLTCVGHTRTDVAALLVDYRRMGVENILALGGDLPADGSTPAGDYRYALDLLADVAATGCFSVGVAAHPEVHPRSPDRATDRKHLADKLRIADFAITQFFFDVEHYIRLVDELAALGIDKPIVPGIMPVTNLAQIHRMAKMSGSQVPGWLVDRLESARTDAEAKQIGIALASALCTDLIDAGAPGLHLYTLNRSEVAKQIRVNLGSVLV